MMPVFMGLARDVRRHLLAVEIQQPGELLRRAKRGLSRKMRGYILIAGEIRHLGRLFRLTESGVS